MSELLASAGRAVGLNADSADGYITYVVTTDGTGLRQKARRRLEPSRRILRISSCLLCCLLSQFHQRSEVMMPPSAGEVHGEGLKRYELI